MADKYITKAELRLPPYEILSDTADDKYLEVLQDLTKDMVEVLCGQSFEKEGSVSVPVEKKVDGTGKDTIFMPKRLLSLSKIKIYSDATTFLEYTPDNFDVQMKYISWAFYNDPQSRVSILNGGVLFPKAIANIGVVGVWGWNEVPNPIKYLQGRLIKKILEDDSFAEKYSAETIGDYSKALNAGGLGINERLFTGDRELDLIIKQYKGWMTYAVV